MHHVISEHVGKTDGFNRGHSNSVHMEHEIFFKSFVPLLFCYSCVEYGQVLLIIEML